MNRKINDIMITVPNIKQSSEVILTNYKQPTFDSKKETENKLDGMLVRKESIRIFYMCI